MRKIVLVIIFVCAVWTIQAGSLFDTSKAENKVVLGVRTGLNLSTKDIINWGYSGDYSAGFNVGLSAEFGILKSLYVNSGFYFTMKGAKCDVDISDGEFAGVDGELSMNPMYVEVPVMASYRLNVDKDLHFHLDFGPWFAYGLDGKAELNLDKYGKQGKVDYFDAGGRRFNMGLAVEIGGSYSQFCMDLNIQYGLTNAISTPHVDYHTYNWSINLGYNFYCSKR